MCSTMSNALSSRHLCRAGFNPQRRTIADSYTSEDHYRVCLTLWAKGSNSRALKYG